MTNVRNRKVIAYRASDDIIVQLEKLKSFYPNVSFNNMVDALVRYSLEELDSKEVSFENKSIIKVLN